MRKAALQSRLLTLKKAGLKVVAVDHEGLALERALPNSSAVIDIGHERTSLHYYGEAVPRSAHCLSGGAEITRAVERELCLNKESAEKRKCTLGTLGAGDSARVALTLKLSHLFEEMVQERPRPQRITLVGNGSRLEGIAAELERHTGVFVATCMPQIMSSEAYCTQTSQASAADWSLAIGLSVWGMAADY
ncbi:MAG: pilus assembly protein PilM [Candidatus Eremiobacteraeota bacterium]|nr:pilus assembly protein PilM [Candidatus Eremiobacteraeota bacterium]